MEISETTNYPGSNASAKEIIQLAVEYHKAAETLLKSARKREPLTRAPSRLCAIHAIELYLNAVLLCAGKSPEEIRSQRHDLAARCELTLSTRLKLRKKTAEHLSKLSRDREYLVSRYGPEMTSTLSEINRLIATLEEVSRKVCAIVLGRDDTAVLLEPLDAIGAE